MKLLARRILDLSDCKRKKCLTELIRQRTHKILIPGLISTLTGFTHRVVTSRIGYRLMYRQQTQKVRCVILSMVSVDSTMCFRRHFQFQASRSPLQSLGAHLLCQTACGIFMVLARQIQTQIQCREVGTLLIRLQPRQMRLPQLSTQRSK